MNKLISIVAGLLLATTALAVNAAQPRQKAQEQQARAELDQNRSGAEQARRHSHRDRDDYYWDEGWYDEFGRYHRYHRRHHRDDYGPSFVFRLP